MILRAHATRPMLLALAGALVLLGVFAGTASTASADEYGGLGSLGTFIPGENGGHLEVNPVGNHAFGVDPADGCSYIADEIKVADKRYLRIQKLGPTGEYVNEVRVELTVPVYQLDGIAIDSEKERVYLLVVTERQGENEELEEKLFEDEEKLTTKEGALQKKKEKEEPTEPLEHEIEKLKSKIKTLEGEIPVFDPEAPVAARLYAFATNTLEPASGTREGGLLTSEATLDSFSESAGASLLDPHGIAVDPVTHDVLILGQQDQSTKKGTEDLRAAVQRVHTEGADVGELGPRYVDEEDCLEGREVQAEPACTEGGDQPSSPFVSPGGRLYGERSGELWEIPAAEGVSEGSSEAFAPGLPPKVYAIKPKRLFTVGRGQGLEGEEGIAEPVSEEEEGAALAFVSTGPGNGKIYLNANIISEEGEGKRSSNRGAIVLEYNENGTAPEARDVGWTAGQNGTSENTKCILPLGNPQILVGAESTGRLLLLDITTESRFKHELASVQILQFGKGGDECGHAQATPPSVTISGTPVTALKINQKASLSLDVFAADTDSVEWKFLNNGKEQADEPPVLESYPFPTQVPTLQHEFKHGGAYEVIAIVEPDDFGPKIEVHSNVTVEGEEGGSGGVAIGAEFSCTSPATAGRPAKFTAKVTDPNNRTSPHAQYKYVWEFGDGVTAEGSGGREFRVEHAYAIEGRYEVKLEVTDEAGRTTVQTHVVQVNALPVLASMATLGGSGSSGAGGGAGGGTAGVKSTRVPDATLARTSLAVSGSGGVTLKVACPADETSCAGTVTLRTVGVVSTSARRHISRGVLTLAAGSFTVAGGHVKAVTLRLSAKARELLARSHVLRVQATLLAHDPSGASHTTRTVVTLRVAKPSHRRKH